MKFFIALTLSVLSIFFSGCDSPPEEYTGDDFPDEVDVLIQEEELEQLEEAEEIQIE